MKPFTAKHLQDLADYVLNCGDLHMSERGATIELLNATLKMGNPRDRIDTSRHRKMNLAFAFAEFVAMVTGVDDVSFFSQFVTGYEKYSSDGITLDGAYGTRMVENGDQIAAVCDLLKAKPNSRRAVITFYKAGDITRGEGGLNTPCTLSMQFLVRDGHLHAVTTMRSNDIHYGLTNDIVVFTMVQEMVADRLGLKLGTYFHNVGSLHIYTETNLKFSKSRDDSLEARWPHLMERMSGAFNDPAQLIILRGALTDLSDNDTFEMFVARLSSDYARDIAFCAKTFFERKDVLLAKPYYNCIKDKTLRRVMLPWLRRG